MKKLVVAMVALVVGALVASAAPRPPASVQSGNATLSVEGKLTGTGGKYFVTDEATNATVEVRGEGLQKYVGQRVSVTGQVTPGPAGSPQILTATQISRAAKGRSKAAAAGVKGGLSTAAVVGIVGGGAAATVGTLYATDVIGADEQSVSRK